MLPGVAAHLDLSARLTRKWTNLREYSAALGFVPAMILILAELSARIQQTLQWSLHPVRVRLRVRSLRYPITLRLFTTDAWVARQILVERQYRAVETAGPNAFMIDLGAYIGLYSALVLSRRDDVRVIAVEPDPANAALARRNLAPYGPRVELIPNAIWHEQASLTIENYGSGVEWGVRVRLCREGEMPHLNTVTMGELLKRAGRDHVDVLKVDIEGSEEQLFGGTRPWLDAVDVIAIELHGPAATRAVETALTRAEWSRESHGEIIVFRRSGEVAKTRSAVQSRDSR